MVVSTKLWLSSSTIVYIGLRCYSTGGMRRGMTMMASSQTANCAMLHQHVPSIPGGTTFPASSIAKNVVVAAIAVAAVAVVIEVVALAAVVAGRGMLTTSVRVPPPQTHPHLRPQLVFVREEQLWWRWWLLQKQQRGW